jgi:hypothetical protein
MINLYWIDFLGIGAMCLVLFLGTIGIISYIRHIKWQEQMDVMRAKEIEERLLNNILNKVK